MELLAGCGASRAMRLKLPGVTDWSELVTLDINDEHKPDVVHDLTKLPYPFEDDTFEQIHAYEVLEHLGQQGDYKSFFAQFSEFWRILKPDGHLVGSSPAPSSGWAWGDPGHTRIIGPECFVYLCQPEYDKQVGKTSMTDYRFCYQADFEPVASDISNGKDHNYALKAIKPSRITTGKSGGTNGQAA